MCLLFSISIDWLLWHSVSLTVTHEPAHTFIPTHKESGRRVQCCPALLLPLKMVFFLPLSQTSWEGYTALCVQRHSLFIFPSLILSFSHSRDTKSEEKSFTWTGKATGRTQPQKSGETKREGGREKTRYRGRKGRCVCVFVFPCFVPFSAHCSLTENDRRMSGWRERLFSLRPCHGKHIHALWDLFIPWYTAHTHIHTCMYTLHVRSLSSHTHPVRGEGGERSDTSVMEQEVLEQSALHNIQLQHVDRTDRQLLWVGHSFGRQKGIQSPAHSPLICCLACIFCPAFMYICCVISAREHILPLSKSMLTRYAT